MVSSGPNPWLVSKTALSESSPCIPPVLVVVGIGILIREIAHEKHRLAIALQVMLQSGSRVVCLSQVPCHNHKTIINKPPSKSIFPFFPLLTYRRSSKLFIWLDACILTDEAKRVGSVKTVRGRGNEPKLAGVFTGSNLVIVFLVVLQPKIQRKRSRVLQSTWRIDRGYATEAELQIKCRNTKYSLMF